MSKKSLITGIIIAFVLGIVIAVSAYYVYTVYQLEKVVAKHDAVLQQIVDLINQSQPKK